MCHEQMTAWAQTVCGVLKSVVIDAAIYTHILKLVIVVLLK